MRIDKASAVLNASGICRGYLSGMAADFIFPDHPVILAYLSSYLSAYV